MQKTHKIISFVFQPLLMPTYGMLLLVNLSLFQAIPFQWKLISILGTFLFTGLMPAMPVLLLLRKGQISDLFISKREQRTLPYVFSIISYAFWTYFLYRILNLPLFLVAMGGGITLSILLITLINIRWKISAHMSGIGGFVGGVFAISYRMAYNPVWFIVLLLGISALVALSRIELKAHTPWQTLAGFTVGFLTVFFPCFLI